MLESATHPNSGTPELSVIVPVYNDWKPLEGCLRSLAQQKNAPAFEVIVVDDGSDQAAPNAIRNFSNLPFTLIRQSHSGISTAKNTGIRASRGAVLVFTDADCRTDQDCLRKLNDMIARSPEHDSFQLRLTGDGSNLVGRAEDLRLSALQTHLLQPNGCIRYLNTAGFAIRRSAIDVEQGLFDRRAQRAEDTMLLANLMQKQQLPLFARDAVVQHAIPLTFSQCLAKDVRSACLETETFLRIESMGVKVRMGESGRFQVMRSAWRASRGMRLAWLVLLCRKVVRRIVGIIYSLSRRRKIIRGFAPSRNAELAPAFTAD